MTGPADSDRAYCDELARWVRALAGVAAPSDDLCAALAPGSSPGGLAVFAQENVQKRREKLAARLATLADTFDDLDELVSTYAATVPAPAYEWADGERFLDWLEQATDPTPEQRDAVACQRAHLALEAAARANRRGHRRFQELWGRMPPVAGGWEPSPQVPLRLNPTRAWARLQTAALLGEGASVPADVLFVAAGEAIRTAVLEPHVRDLVERLASSDPVTLADWGARSGIERAVLAEVCRDLLELGLIAVDPVEEGVPRRPGPAM